MAPEANAEPVEAWMNEAIDLDGSYDPEGDITQQDTWPVISSYFR